MLFAITTGLGSCSRQCRILTRTCSLYWSTFTTTDIKINRPIHTVVGGSYFSLTRILFSFVNRALALNCNTPVNDKDGGEAKNWKAGRSVRVIRSSKGRKHSKYSPEDGNRYDGIYKVRSGLLLRGSLSTCPVVLVGFWVFVMGLCILISPVYVYQSSKGCDVLCYAS